MNILVACEESGTVRDAFIQRGHNAISCDIIPSSSPGPHLQQDVTPILKEKWDLIIAFPPCTHLAVSGAKHFEKKRLNGKQREAINFFMKFINANSEKIAIENPVGIISGNYIKKHFPDLCKLKPTKLVDKGEFWVSPDGKKRMPKWFSDNKCSKIRSKTFQGIAEAMAEQWG